MNRYFNFIKKKSLHFINKLLRLFFWVSFLPKRANNLFARLVIKKFPPSLAYGFEWIVNKKSPVNRRYIKKGLSIDSFFEKLNDRRIRYVVLRWFDNLPDVQSGEDIDLLIHDKDLSKVEDLFTYVPYTQPCDLYTTTGINGTSYKDVPYYPPLLAKQILETRVLINSRYYVPDPKRHFLSLAYHAVFHKGSRSGLENRQFKQVSQTDHDYVRTLMDIDEQIGLLGKDIDYQGLFQILKNNNWVPEIDTLRILAKSDPWIKQLAESQENSELTTDGDLIVFVIREWALSNDFIHQIQSIIKSKFKLEILYSKELNQSEMYDAHYHVRGGKWHRGPYPSHGGEPAYLIVCFDYMPEWGGHRVYPYVKNLKVLKKHDIRRLINESVLYPNNANFIHSSDDQVEAVNYIKKVVPEIFSNIVEKVNERQYFFSEGFEVIEVFKSNNTRAKIEKISYMNRLCVKKTFKLGYERYLNREIFASRDLRENIRCIPEYVSSDSNYVITVYSENVLKTLPRDQAKEKIKENAQAIVDAMRDFYEHGFAIIGFYPGNLIITPDNRVLVIDYEFLHRYENVPDSFLDSYDIAGVPDDFKYDMPVGTNHTYKNTWEPIIGPIEQYLK